MSYSALVTREPRTLAFGFTHTIAATLGQTFVIALFLPSISAELGLSERDISVWFAIATIATALVLPGIGRLIDKVDVVRYSLASALLLGVGAFVIAATHTAAMFGVGLFAIRLGGHGLLSHAALTATARYFGDARGKALSLVSIGSAVGEDAAGLMLVALIDSYGWRTALALSGVLALLLVAAATWSVRRNSGFRLAPREAVDTEITPSRKRVSTVRSESVRYFVMSAPLFIAPPLVITALVFHQAAVAHAAGFSLAWFAAAFVAFAFTRVGSSLAVGPVIDRVGASRVFAFHLLPLCAGMLALAVSADVWVVPVYWTLAGITGGASVVLQVVVIAERVPPARLGKARSAAAALIILAAAVGPVLFGSLIGAGVRIDALLVGSAAAMLAATALGVAAGRAPATRAGDFRA